MVLYHLNEFKKAASFSVVNFSQAQDLFLSFMPDNKLKHLLSISNEMTKRMILEERTPQFNINKTISIINDEKIECSVLQETVVNDSFCKLEYFKKIHNNKEVNSKEKMLIVAPLSGHFATLLRDTVQTCLQDFDVYVTNWIDAKLIPLSCGDFSLDDYVDYILKYLKFLKKDVHVLAVCQPAVPVLMAASLISKYKMNYAPKSMVLMGGPIDTRINQGEVDEFAKQHDINWFKCNIINKIPNYYPGAGRKVCPGFILLNGFMMLNIDKHQMAHYKLFENLIKGDTESIEKHKKFYNEYRAVMDLPATYFLNSIEQVFQKHSLPQNKMPYRNEKINLKDIKDIGLITIEGELDDISPVGQTSIALDLCTNISKNLKTSYIQNGVGHYGIFSGSKWRNKIYHKIRDFCYHVKPC